MTREKIIKIGLTFYICSILGFMYELIYHYVQNHKLLSHGYLKGPWLPIYGIGSILISCLDKYREEPLKIFVFSFFLTGILEGISGYLLLKCLKIRLWDYTGRFLNIGGFVCFISALCFGVSGLIVTYIINPIIDKIIKNENKEKLMMVLEIMSVCFLIDLIAYHKK